MSKIFEKIEYYILYIKYTLLNAFHDIAIVLNDIVGQITLFIAVIIADVNIVVFDLSKFLEKFKLNFSSSLSVFVKTKRNIIIISALSYIGFCILIYILKHLISYVRYRKLIKREEILLEALKRRKIFELRSLFSKEFYSSLFSRFAKFISKVLTKILFIFWEKFGNLKVFQNPKFVYEKLSKVFKVFAYILDLFGMLIEKGLSLVKLIEPKTNEIDLFISNIVDKGIETLKTDIPEVIQQEFELSENSGYPNYMKFILSYKKLFDTAIDKWENDLLSSMLFIGKRGSGKTSLLNNAIDKYLKDYETIYVTISPDADREGNLERICNQISGKNTIEETLDFLNNKKERMVIILENVHFLFLRNHGNYSYLMKLFTFIGNTNTNVLWLVTIHEYTYRFISQFMPINDLFDFKLRLNLMKGDDIRRLFIRKAKSRGYNIYPRLSLEQLKLVKKKIKKGELRYADLAHYVLSEYFGKLVEKCENIFPALYFYFLRSVVQVEKNRIYISDARFMDISFIEEIPPQYFFILTGIIIHDMLTIDEILADLNLSKGKFEVHMAYLMKKKIIQTKEMNGKTYYYINPILEVELSELLKKRNYLYF